MFDRPHCTCNSSKVEVLTIPFTSMKYIGKF